MPKKLSTCKVFFIIFLYLYLNMFLLGIYFLITDLTIFLEINILNFNSVSVLMTILTMSKNMNQFLKNSQLPYSIN